MSSLSSQHLPFMHAALLLAEAQLGQTWPNPSVGAVIVKNGTVIAEAATAKGGRPHAETQALEQAGSDAKGATLYVTLEPCSHHGKTPPCTDAIINAGITHCVVACRDPHPDVNGEGIAQLRKAGIEVTEGIGRDEATALNRGFFSAVTRQRPFVSMKLATSQDGKITTGNPNQRWITSEPAREYGNRLRSHYDAIATGIGTVLADNPRLTCRIPGMEDRSPRRLVFDRGGRLPKGAAIQPAETIHEATVEGALKVLAHQGITRLLVEAGQALSTSFLQEGMVDRIYWFRSPHAIGAGGMDALAGGFSPVLPPKGWTCVKSVVLSPDTLDIYELCSPAS